MRAIRVHRYGGPEALSLDTMPDPAPGPGQAVLYGTTPLFLERLGLNSVDDLPPLVAFVPGAEVVVLDDDGRSGVPATDARTTTDDAGAFRLGPLRANVGGTIWFEADGYGRLRLGEHQGLVGQSHPVC